MSFFTAFNYNLSKKDRDVSKLYETQKFESSNTDQDFISLPDLVQNGVSGVLRTTSGLKKKKVMIYDNNVDPVDGYDLADYNPGLEKIRVQLEEEKENVQKSKTFVSGNSALDRSQSTEETSSQDSK